MERSDCEIFILNRSLSRMNVLLKFLYSYTLNINANSEEIKFL